LAIATGREAGGGAERCLAHLYEMTSGTAILWQDLDRLTLREPVCGAHSPCFRNTLNVQANFQKTGRIGIQPRIRILMAWARVRPPVPDRT
jgi:hypothetical protein